ncbi:MAG: hypothetical protein A2W59_02155 [Candidatus Terrybacteria bacterium RIFCSPHIGHO2_02_41_19]|uniref:AAA+ ATPase domain-containing protein n=1 Tax=Candidatus Terrybacteria bacterium RIFCSPHIGHO2_02_41_19 TaxID=1802364 RepID=A0A1G2PN80_9BACT|nr:MAG: hypothetical protein A2W59_02155 [Candidatus Terrybacteria bacterium RIFCSPHIGHO2_02_41_19]
MVKISDKFIKRAIMSQIKNRLKPGRVAVIYGPRRVGKTTLLHNFLEEYDGKYKLYNGEDLETQKIFTAQSAAKYQSLLRGLDLLVIDEAQKIENIGLNLKLIVDTVEGLNIIASGSSSFDLAKHVGEPLTGRKWNYTLFPLSQLELSEFEDIVETHSLLEERLIYGGYPEVIISGDYDEKKNILKEIVNSYLFKDILELEGLRYKKKIPDLLTLLAFQVGQEVSLNELANNLNISKATVQHYLYLLEEVFVIYNLRGFSRNLRKEVTKTSKYYFYDNGIRNAIVGQFNQLDKRNDVGQLWENYIIAERIKKQKYKEIFCNNYFWRTYEQKEIDWIEEREGKLFAYEIKWKNSVKEPPKDFTKAYQNSEFHAINRDNYLDFIA